jgi:hypothetical protein
MHTAPMPEHPSKHSKRPSELMCEAASFNSTPHNTAPRLKKSSPKVACGKLQEAEVMSTEFPNMTANIPAHVRDLDFGLDADTLTRCVKMWQYNGCAPFSDLCAWCRDNMPGGWWYRDQTFYFVNEKNHTLFLLRWA